MKKHGNLLVGKTAVNSEYPAALVSANVTGFSIRGNELSIISDDKSTKLVVDPSQVNETTDILTAVIKENHERYIDSGVDESMVVTLISSGEGPNLIVGKTPVKTTSFRLSEVVQISGAYSKVVIVTTPKTITLNVPPTTDAMETINRLFNPDEKRLIRECGVDHTLYQTFGKFDEEWQW